MTDDILVIGSGVTGLTTAVLLAEAGQQVLVRTAALPLESTSAVAGALLGPIIDDEDDRVNGWLIHGDNVFRELAQDPATGVRVARGRLISKSGGGVPAWAPQIPGFEECTGDDLPAGYSTAFWVQLPIADMRRYLTYLTSRSPPRVAGLRSDRSIRWLKLQQRLRWWSTARAYWPAR